MVSMPTARDKAIDRVRKLLAIAERATTPIHEREAMRRQAQRLISKHDIAEHETQSAPPQPPRSARRAHSGFTFDDLLEVVIDVVDAAELARRKQNKNRWRGR